MLPSVSALRVVQAIFLRQIAYLYQTTRNAAMKSSISSIIQKSASAALATCDKEWDCTGDWTNGSTQVYPDFRSTHLVGAALVAAASIGK